MRIHWLLKNGIWESDNKKGETAKAISPLNITIKFTYSATAASYSLIETQLQIKFLSP
jgi:hypothetical protein